jgi:hypothetical protein
MLSLLSNRKPELIGNPDDPYLKRWFVIPHNRLFNVYLHRFCRSDDDRALHDHPWWNISILLRGSYIEHMPHGSRLRRRGSLIFRRGSNQHRIELIDNQTVWTLFLTGPKYREWGFACPQGWRHWRDFVESTPEGNQVGRGCD